MNKKIRRSLKKFDKMSYMERFDCLIENWWLFENGREYDMMFDHFFKCFTIYNFEKIDYEGRMELFRGLCARRFDIREFIV